MNNPLVIFDGICNLCESTVQFIIKEDKKKLFKFTPFQSDYARAILKDYNLSNTANKTVILIYKNRAYTKSTAILKILKLLGFYYKLFAIIMLIIPKFFRDLIYNYISSKRYFWFGKKEKCLIPTQEIQDRFL